MYYWRMRLVEVKGGYVNSEVIEKIREATEIMSIEVLIEKRIKQNLKEAREEWVISQFKAQKEK